MYHTKGINEIVNSIKRAIGLSKTTQLLMHNKVRNSYHSFLMKHSVFENHHFFSDIMITDFHGFKKIAPRFCKEKKTHFSKNSFILQERLINGFFTDALEKLKKINNELFDLTQFVIKVILLNHLHTHTNGTTENTIGLSCIDFKDHFDENDFIELIVHQVTHMLLFMDDITKSHMLPENKKLMIETHLKFVSGGTKFPAYLAFHSYIVGIEILYFRWQSTGLNYKGNYHGDTPRIIRVCRMFKQCLLNNISLFTEHGQSILTDSFTLLDQASIAYHA